MTSQDIEQRKQHILQLIIEAHISTASPVGSELVAKRLRSALSPATIRNIMVDLERAGYLEQPHTSAGRVPTDRGYRFYVDAVMGSRELSPQELRLMDSILAPAGDLEQLLSRASSALSQLTQQAGFAVSPSVKQSHVKQVEFVPVSVRKILCVMVADEEIVASHVVEVAEPISRDEAIALTRFINTELSGLSCQELLHSLQRRMLAETDSFYHVIKRSLDILQHALSTEPDERLLIDGMMQLVSQPEFSRDPETTRELLRGVDEEAALLEQVRKDLVSGGVRVRIGRELALPGFASCSYIAAPVLMDGRPIAGIGILGPKRMDYARSRALVEGMSRCLSAFASRWESA